MAPIDVGFVLAVVALGWGLSLATYRFFAARCDWPIGVWHLHWPSLALLVGLSAVAPAGLFAAARAYGGYTLSALAIPLFGLAWAAFWTGFLRVGAQSALLLAPAAAVLLLWHWSG
jgi:hypothetical protein